MTMPITTITRDEAKQTCVRLMVGVERFRGRDTNEELLASAVESMDNQSILNYLNQDCMGGNFRIEG